MKRVCPTIQELLAFDAVARHESVTQAANDLCISVSGVSKQLAGLEAFVGRQLLKKSGRGVQLTASGREYWMKISPGLRIIEAATVQTREADTIFEVLVIACAPTFLSKWLIPRLTGFKQCNPSVTFVFSPHVGLREVFPFDIDAAISHGLGNWPNVTFDYITGNEFVCIYSPELPSNGQEIRTANHLVTYTLLHLEQAPLAWRKWAAHHGLDEAQTLPGPRFTQYSAIIQAVMSGLGVGLVPKILVEKQLQDGKAISFCSLIDEDQGHYLCFKSDRPNRPAFTAFRSWIIEQGKGETAENAASDRTGESDETHRE